MSSVLHVITGLGVGGAETMLAQVATALQARGLPQHVVSLRGRGPIADTLEDGGIRVTVLDIDSWKSLPRGVARLSRLIVKSKPDYIQGWMYHGNIAAVLAHRLVLGSAQRKLYWNLRASEMDAERYERIVRWSARLSRWPDLVISNSQAGIDFHNKCGYRSHASMLIPNGFDTEKFKPDASVRKKLRSRLGIPLDAVVAFKAARVDAMKDHTNFLNALAQVPDMIGILAGQDTETLTLPPNVMGLGLRSDIARLCAASDITVCSSAFGEGFSNALAEGMSAGLVPVATDVGDTALIVGDTGHIVAPRDSQALAHAISQVADLEQASRRESGLRARQRIVENFTLERIVNMYGELYGG